MADHSVKGRTALVTGAARGIGESIARKLAEDGAHVAIGDLKASDAEAAAEAIASGTGAKTLGLAMDVTSEEQVNEGCERIAAELGGIDILVSNAGIQIVHPVEAFPFDKWKLMLAVHLDGAFLTTKACLPGMYQRGHGRIIYMGSVHSKDASPLKSAYVTAKHGLLGLARVVAREGGERGVAANVVCPGFVKTPLVDKQIPEQSEALGIPEEEVVRDVMLGRTVTKEFTTVEDVVSATRFLAGFPTLAMTGQSLLVSGGWVME